MEHERIIEWFHERGTVLPPEKAEALLRYANLINDANGRFNLTGFRDADSIIVNLVLSSLEPLLHIDVPRGTRFIDIGSGSGIPGIPLCVMHDDVHGLLIDSNYKKTSFVDSVIHELVLNNAEIRTARAEELGHEKSYREAHSMAFCRALSGSYSALELSLPFLSTGGLLYIYSHDNEAIPPLRVLAHADELGASLLPQEERIRMRFTQSGLIFSKDHPTPERYPRRWAVIKREEKKVCDNSGSE